MSYTTERQPEGIAKSVDGFLREGLIAELLAINDYRYFIASTDNKELKEIFYEIMDDEKSHYAMFLEALRSIDEELKGLKEGAEKNIKISDKGKYSDYNNKSNKNTNLLVNIRDAIKGELEAILLYEHFILNLSDNTIRRIIKEIITDEKEHVEELTRVLIILDKDKYGNLKC
ncbi:ferritin family protein [Clostridium vincentii]|uniref:Rubrerythrin n=1 Tax=Clostridium vincentii TaxID=52704 RepID=A0A2T0BII7_9CLOT|nr:ferritin-like domain-containing protein [Clostridium vincentii]PRR83706.1 Rubrerythrin [Clostridium vincentii]